MGQVPAGSHQWRKTRPECPTQACGFNRNNRPVADERLILAAEISINSVTRRSTCDLYELSSNRSVRLSNLKRCRKGSVEFRVRPRLLRPHRPARADGSLPPRLGEEAASRAPTVRCAPNNADAMMPTLRAGLGLAVQPECRCPEDLAAGRLEAAMADWSRLAIALSIVTPPRWAPSGPRRCGDQVRAGQAVRHALDLTFRQGTLLETWFTRR